VLDALRGERQPPESQARQVAAVLDELRCDMAGSQSNLTLRELVARVDASAPPPPTTRRTS
jgi:hypothetical protein